MTTRALVICALLVLGCAGTSEERIGQTEAAVVGGGAGGSGGSGGA